MTLSKEMLNELYEYKDGELYYKVTRAARARQGAIVGSIHTQGYRVTKINNIEQKIHRLIFALHHGWWPLEVDHINGARADNRIENLRSANDIQNAQNAKLRKDNTSGVKGVHWDKVSKKWMVRVSVLGKEKYFGVFADLEFAELVAIEVREKYHGAFARHA